MKGQIRLGVLGGSGIYDLEFLEECEIVGMDTEYGRPSSPMRLGKVGNKKVAFLSRHGEMHKLPAHRLPHKANIKAMKELGVDQIVSTSSVGSLKEEIKPGSFLVPNDYFSPWLITTYFDDKVKHITPSLDPVLRSRLIEAARELNYPVYDGGVYIQTIGPRLETKAEISFMSRFGDVVGMTVASEATLANELDIRYASLCMVDNYCHGLVDEPLTYESIVQNQKKSAKRAIVLLKKFLGALP